MALADFPQIESLSPQEKLDLLYELWESIALALETQEVPEAERQVLEDRWRMFLEDSSKALTVEQFRERVRLLRK